MKLLSRNLSYAVPSGVISSVFMPQFTALDPETFRRRLAAAVERVGRKRVARMDGEHRDESEKISQGGLTKILSGERENPGIFTIKQIASDAGVTVGELLGEEGFELTQRERDEAMEMVHHIFVVANWLEKVFANKPKPGAETANAEAPNNVRVMERTPASPTAGFRVPLEEFNDNGATDYPRAFHGWEEEGSDEKETDSPMPTLWLNSKEVRSAEKLTVRVRDDKVHPYFEGCKLLIDTTKKGSIEDGECAVAYSETAGTFVGYVERRNGRMVLETSTGESITVGDAGYELLGLVADAWIPKQRRKKGGAA